MPAAPTEAQLPPAAPEDHSAEILRVVKKEPLDRVKCVRVFDSYYRCNWWSPLRTPTSGHTPQWAVGTTHYVRKSAFFRASLRDGHVVVEEVIAPPRDD
jgi:hypothetical protein